MKEEKQICILWALRRKGRREGGREGSVEKEVRGRKNHRKRTEKRREGGREEGHVPGADGDKVEGVVQAFDVILLDLQPGVGSLRRLVLVRERLALCEREGRRERGRVSWND
jgi:hypothetical protein